MTMPTQQTDFVITWIKDNDSNWLNEKSKYLSGNTSGDGCARQNRNWGLLRYWFRGVEKFAPWVHKIHFVTEGHLPGWLNTGHDKLNIVKHADFIPEQHLPTFNSNAIELFMHKIPGLTEQFVYFNDDMFLINKAVPQDFFKDNLPCDLAVLGAVLPQDEPVTNIIFNNVKIINRYFRKKDLTIHQWRKVLCLCYGKLLVRSLCLYPFSRHTGFYDPHLAIPFTKNTFETVWNHIPDELSETCMHRFRSPDDLSIWLMRYWSLAKGEFVPHAMPGKYFEIGNPDLVPFIRNQKGKIVCCNDVRDGLDFETEKRRLAEAFASILPEKSRFEK